MFYNNIDHFCFKKIKKTFEQPLFFQLRLMHYIQITFLRKNISYMIQFKFNIFSLSESVRDKIWIFFCFHISKCLNKTWHCLRNQSVNKNSKGKNIKLIKMFSTYFKAVRVTYWDRFEPSHF
jgi:hypothetical protein